jgi:hypothetical protein
LIKAALVLEQLQTGDFCVNLRKSVFAVHETEYLGYWLTQKGLQPQPKKVAVLMRLTQPKTKRQVHPFLGRINYYHDMWQSLSHLLVPLSEMMSEKTTFAWEDGQQKGFNKIKAVMSRETLLWFPNSSKAFHIYTAMPLIISWARLLYKMINHLLSTAESSSWHKRTTQQENKNPFSIVETLKTYYTVIV